MKKYPENNDKRYEKGLWYLQLSDWFVMLEKVRMRCYVLFSLLPALPIFHFEQISTQTVPAGSFIWWRRFIPQLFLRFISPCVLFELQNAKLQNHKHKNWIRYHSDNLHDEPCEHKPDQLRSHQSQQIHFIVIEIKFFDKVVDGKRQGEPAQMQARYQPLRCNRLMSSHYLSSAFDFKFLPVFNIH